MEDTLSKKNLFIFFFMICIPSLVQASNSIYTSIDRKDCKMLEDSANDPKAEIDYFTMRCPGRDGYEIFVQGGDLRSWIEIKKKGKKIFDLREDPSFFKYVPGSFPYISGTKLEWRYNSQNQLLALIVRLAGGDESGTKEQSILYVIRHKEGKFCILGSKRNNEEAQTLADSVNTCTFNQ